MKAALIRRKQIAPRTHDLIELSKLVSKAVASWDWDEDELRFLSSGAVAFRYPGTSAKRNPRVESLAHLQVPARGTHRTRLIHLRRISFPKGSIDGSGKPFGAIGLQLVVHVNDGPGLRGNPDNAKLVGTFTRNPITVSFSRDDDRKKATYWARWISRRGETGPWSYPTSMSVPA